MTDNSEGTSKPRYWMGPPPERCDLSYPPGLRNPTTNAKTPNHRVDTVFIDGAVRGNGWANMCAKCHSAYGTGLGMGKGQKYVKQEDGRWLKVEG